MDSPMQAALGRADSAVVNLRGLLGRSLAAMTKVVTEAGEENLREVAAGWQAVQAAVAPIESHLATLKIDVEKEARRRAELIESHTRVLQAHTEAVAANEARLASLGAQVTEMLRTLDDLQRQQAEEQSKLRVAVARREAAERRADEAEAKVGVGARR
jgi:hypothetical protein